MLTTFLNNTYQYLDLGSNLINVAAEFIMRWCLATSIALAGLFYAVEGQDGLSSLIRKLLAISFVGYLYSSWGEWSLYIRDGFLALADAALPGQFAIRDFLDPNRIWYKGRILALNILANQATFSLNPLEILSRLADLLFTVIFVVPVVMFVFINAGVQAFISLVVWKLIMTLGVLLIPFNLLQATEFIGNQVFTQLLRAGIRLFSTYFCIGVGWIVFRNYELPASATLGDLMDLTGGAVAYGALITRVPPLMEGLISGTPAISALMKPRS